MHKNIWNRGISAMNELIDKKLYNLFINFFPQKYAHLNIIENLDRLYIVPHKSRSRVLYELQIHKESMDEKNIVAIGFDDLMNKLHEIRDERICIIHASNDEYSFDIYLNNELSDRLGYLLIRRRKKTKEEILWEKNLGIINGD